MDKKVMALSELCEVITKGTTPTTLGYEFQREGIGFLKIECFDEDGNFIPDKMVYISEECNEKLKRSQLKMNDILFSIAGAIGRVGIVSKDMLPANTNQALAIIRINKNDIFIPYIKLILTSNIVKEQYEKQKQGVAQLNLSLKNIGDLRIPICSLEKQVEYVKLFENIQKLIGKQQAQLKAYDNLIKSRFVEMFGQGFPLATADMVCSVIVDCPHSTPKYDGDKLIFPAIRTSEIRNGQIEWSSMRYVSHSEYIERTKRLIPEAGDIVYAREGTYGDCVILPEGERFCLGQRTMLFRPDGRKCISAYLHQVLRSDIVKRQADESNAGSTVPHVNVADAKKFNFPLPPMELQQQFAAFVHQVDKLKVVAQKRLEQTQILFDSLMQQYFG